MSSSPENQRERALLIGTKDAQSDFKWIEFVELLKAAGALEVGRVIQNKDELAPALFLGSGKTEELAALIEVAGADLDFIHRTGRVLAAEYTAEGIKVTAELEPALAVRLDAESAGPSITKE
jgi:hypothetical protein